MAGSIWLLDLPASLYNENVKALAQESKLTIIDSMYSANYSEKQVVKNPPKVTLIKEKAKPKRKAVKAK